MADTAEQDTLVALTIQIVSAFVTRNHVQASELPRLLRDVHSALHRIGSDPTTPPEERKTLSAPEVRRSIQPEGLISFEDGKPYKTLRRHLTKHGLTPEAYRAKWGLPADYPMTAPAYSAQRSRLAVDLGLGRQRSFVTEVEVGGSAEPQGTAEPQLTQAASSAMPTTIEVLREAETEDGSDERVTREPFEDDGAAP